MLKSNALNGRVIATLTASSREEAVSALELLLDRVSSNVYDDWVEEYILVTDEGEA